MTIDDENSIYVGGIRYDCTEDDLRHAFELFGAIVAVKIINGRGKGGKCYSFVSFTNPRSAVDAIRGMNGATIGGRMVRVNEVRTRGAGVRPNYSGETFRPNPRSMDMNRGRGREREHDEHEKDRYRDRSRQSERGYEFTRGEEPRGLFYDRDEDVIRGVEYSSRGNSRVHDHETEQDHDSDFEQERHTNRVYSPDRGIGKEKQDTSVEADNPGRGLRQDKDQQSKKTSRSSSYDWHGREFSTESSDYYHKAEEQVDSLSQRREELIKENSEMQQKLNEKNQHIVDLRRRSLKLEDALTSAKKVYSLRQTQLTKVHKCFLQVKDYGERLKNSEQELQGLVESLIMDLDASGDGDTRMGIENGEVRGLEKGSV